MPEQETGEFQFQMDIWTQTPSTTPLQPKKWNAHFWITFNFWWSARLVDGLKPHLPPLSNQKYKMLIFGLCSTSDDWPGWLMDSNPVCHPSPAKKMKWSLLDYVQLLMIGQAGRWTWTPSTTPVQPENEILIFGLHSTSGDRLGWSMDSNPIHHPCPAKKWNDCFWITFNFWWSAGLVDGLKPHPPPLSSQKNEMLVFGLHSTSDDRSGWLMDLNPIHHPSSAKKMKCSFLDYVQLLMISWAGRWTQTPSATPPQPKKLNACFWITFNFWWSAGLVDGLKPHLPPISSQKNKMLIFGLHLISDDRRSDPSDEWWLKCKNFTFNFWWSARLVDGLKPHLSEDHQKTCRRPPEDCQKTTRKPLAVFWWSSNTMIQRNSYKRLHFYMDFCVISPMASLFVEYTEKKTCFSNSAGILGQHDIVVLADCTIPVPVIVLCLSTIFVCNINSFELHFQSVALRSQYSDHTLEAVTLH